MSMKTLPLLFINLGGEMMYILDQRLRAQNIPEEKSKKVLHDIVSMMYNKRFMEELFKPQYLYSKKAMRTVFDRLAHASIMRLNAASMDKLYDLMMMAFKHQVLLSLAPSDILLITLNHIDAIRNFVKDSQPIRQQVDLVYQLLIETYGGLKSSDFYLIRMTLLNFFQDMHIRVSIFLKDKSQTSNGRFTQSLSSRVGWGHEVPGTIRLFNADGVQTRKTAFTSGGDYQTLPRRGSLDSRGDRVTKLGCNMYIDDKTNPDSSYRVSQRTVTSSDMDMSVPDPLAKAQLDLLAKLIGSRSDASHVFRLNLFETDSEEQEVEVDVKESPSVTDNVLRITATKAENAELQKIMGELQMCDKGDVDKGDNLLDLLDSAQ